MQKGELANSDLEELVELCKAPHGLAGPEPAKPEPLTGDHLTMLGNGADGSSVVLNSLTHIGNVNALLPKQSISFGPALTIVFGGNASGKSGYTRILKQLCRARGSEDILGNVLAGTAPGKPSASISFKKGDATVDFEWTPPAVPPDPLARISVFDAKSAAVYISKATDVAFRPFGLDVFDKLVDAAGRVKKALEAERILLEKQAAQLPEVPPGTEVAILLESLNSLTSVDAVRKLGKLNKRETGRLDSLEQILNAARGKDPEKDAQRRRVRGERVKRLAALISQISTGLSAGQLQALNAARATAEVKRTAAEAANEAEFMLATLPGTGGESWQRLWAAAGHFSAEAFPDHDFPATHEGADCVFCQQEMSPETRERVESFQSAVTSTVRAEAAAAEQELSKLTSVLERIEIPADEHDWLADLAIEDNSLHTRVRTMLASARAARESALSADDQSEPTDFENTLGQDLLEAGDTILEAAEAIEASANPDDLERLESEFGELTARRALSGAVKLVVQEIERKKRSVAYEACIKDTRTSAISKKSSELSGLVVTKTLTDAFQAELAALEFNHVEVALEAAGAVKGNLHHKIVFTRANNVEVEKVVSEGEARALAIAAIFSELSTANEPSGILFDDPVSSLDHRWRMRVAKRLVREASERQVVVFTHDIVFLVALTNQAEVQGVDLRHQQLQRSSDGPGLSLSETPWAAMRTKSRIGALKAMHQGLDAVHRNGEQQAYEAQGAYFYNLLRQTWERALVEVLLNGVVERYRRSIETNKAKVLTDIEKADYDMLERGMSKCSEWMHDKAAAEGTPFPGPPELLGDLTQLEQWVKTIRRRRQS